MGEELATFNVLRHEIQNTILHEPGLDSDDVLLVQDLGCVLPVDVYDTTGEYDIHLNEEVVNTCTFYQSRRSKTCKLSH